MMAAEQKPPTTDPALAFLLGAEFVHLSAAAQLRALLAAILGVDAYPAGDSIVIDGTRLSVGRTMQCPEWTLRAEEDCGVCGDPVRSLPITCQYDLASFLLGRHREEHAHFWLSGE